MNKYYWFVIVIILSACVSRAEDSMREKALEMASRAGLSGWLNAPVRVDFTSQGTVAIRDEGIYFFQYDLETPQTAGEPNVIVDTAVRVPATADKAVFITHGWIDKAQKDWPEKMAEAIRQKTDPNEWICGIFDWSGGSGVVTSIQAAKYARDIGGPRLAAAILKLSGSTRHIHFVGHSVGSWVINTAARRIVKECPGVSLHLTFLDAYVPDGWDSNELGNVNSSVSVWAEHYYTRDITYTMTQMDLAHTHNVDITAIDPLVAEHEFPYRWYLATVTGHYDRWDEKGQDVITSCNGVEYGFARSLEAGKDGWAKNKTLSCGNAAVKIEKKN